MKVLVAGWESDPSAPPKPSQLWLAWRAAALEGGCVIPGAARGIIWFSGGAGAGANLSSSADSVSQQPGSPGNPLGWLVMP